ncbi:expressed unknown protein [Seminavis robusta]|uniref:Uncharacterized protein n=1 Tax=Seminavis robusta TaxID=568900 RepID=A0A9N8E6C8_9STRA|nr:expressed unknown protein [Seminavis robusta]|eukprot:Sro669_g184480.1 n/a (573) ;mRNA; f:9510-11228
MVRRNYYFSSEAKKESHALPIGRKKSAVAARSITTKFRCGIFSPRALTAVVVAMILVLLSVGLQSSTRGVIQIQAYIFSKNTESASTKPSPAAAKPNNPSNTTYPQQIIVQKLAGGVKSSGGAKENLQIVPLELDNTVAEDVVAIEHDPDKAEITVTFKINARCPRPYLIGRLSGPALIRLQPWKWQSHSSYGELAVTSLTSRYEVPIIISQASYYALEIIVVFCDNFFYALNQPDNPIHQDDPSKDWIDSRPELAHYMGQDYARHCVENSAKNRITQKGSSIWISGTAGTPSSQSKQPQPAWKGFWHNKGYKKGYKQPPDGSRTNDKHLLQPVYTRYQLDGWKEEEHPAECNQERFEPYKFHWNQETPLSAQSLRQSKANNICLIGDDHSRSMHERAKEMGFDLPNTNVAFHHLWTTFPENVTEASITDLMDRHRCTSMVASVGHWPASHHTKGHPYTLKQFYKLTKGMLHIVTKHPQVVARNVRVFVQSLNSLPLRYGINDCPATDYRNPLVLDSYNTILKRVSFEFGIPFIDTEEFLVGPMWDASSDWEHVNQATEEAQTLFVAASVLG